jgi:hypothetical protein
VAAAGRREEDYRCGREVDGGCTGCRPPPTEVEMGAPLQLFGDRIVHCSPGGAVTIPISSTPIRLKVANTSITKP